MESANLKVSDLRKELKSRGLAISGTKQELLARLEEAKVEKSSEELSTLDDSLLDDDEELLDTPEDSNEPITITPIPTPTPVTSTKEGTKKLKLNREPIVSGVSGIAVAKTSLSGVSGVTKTSLSGVGIGKSSVPVVANVGVVKLIKTAIQLGEDEKVKLRLNKFGNVGGGKIGIGGNTKLDNAEILKKRNERFGVTSIAGKITLKTSDELKLSKRKARFDGTSMDEKKLKRADRFK